MKKTLFLALLVTVFAQYACSQIQDFSVKGIPDSLLKNAHAVVRYYNEDYNIAGPDEFTIVKRVVVTVLDEKGKSYGNFEHYYGKGTTVKNINASLFDKNGKEIKSLKKNEVVDMAAFGISFVDDLRKKVHSFDCHDYPYTTDYEVEIQFNGTFSLPGWSPYFVGKVAVERASVRVEYPSSFPLRYKTYRLPQPTIHTSDKPSENNWFELVMGGLKAPEEGDDFTPTSNTVIPSLVLAADTFSLLEHTGNMSTWQNFGRFIYQLNENRDVLTPEVKQLVHRMADTCKTNPQKIAVLYKYLQHNTRYVSIQLGIGGLQTFDAAFVCEKKYGDCKALSNFMKSLLKEAGIVSYAAIVSSGKSRFYHMDEDFPANVFNHVILCVPQGGDTTWLECTSPDMPAGYLGGFTANRKVLLITPEGGKVIKTPAYGAESNVLTRFAECTLNEKDELVANIRYNYMGAYWEDENRAVGGAGQSDINRHLNQMLGFANYTVNRSSIKNNNFFGLPSLIEELQVTATAEATRSGNKLILSTAMFPLNKSSISRTDTLSAHFQLHESFKIVDTVMIHLNGEYAAEPFKDVSLEYPFGRYHLAYSLADKKTLIKTSEFITYAGIYPAAQFSDYRKLRNESVGTSRSKLILTKN